MKQQDSTTGQPQNYRAYLRGILIEKQKRNPQLSLRAFAKTLGVQSSFLSMVLNGKRDLSEETALQIAERLKLDADETRKFNLLVRLEKAFSSTQREQILEDLGKVDPRTQGFRDLALDQFKVIAEWYHLPLQILVDLDGFDWSEEAAARMLGISIHQVREALERLDALELIEWTPGERPRKAEGRVFVESPLQNEALRRYHTQMLEKAIQALQDQTPEQRLTRTLNLALDEKQYQKARTVLQAAVQQLSEIAEARAKRKKLYHLNVNLFDLDSNPKPKPEPEPKTKTKSNGGPK